VERQRQAGFFAVVEQILYQRVVEIEIGADLTHALAPLLLVEFQVGREIRLRRVAEVARIDVAEGDETVGIASADVQGLLGRIEAMRTFRVGGRQDDAETDVLLVLHGDQFLRRGVSLTIGPGRAGANGRVDVDIDEHGEVLSDP